MQNSARLLNLFAICGIIVAIVTLSKHLYWFGTTMGLVCSFLGCAAVFYWRWNLLKRQITPETKGSIKKIRMSDLLKIKKTLDTNIIGQSKSIQEILITLKRNMGILNSNRHLGSFLLVGPTGTGKTYFAQTLASGLYGRDGLITMAMNQSGLRGDQLIEILLKALKKDPYRVVLLDEIDKASPDIYASLYHFMESGQIMDPQSGEWFHCPGLIIIATTNAGSENAHGTSEHNSYALLEHVSSHYQMQKAFLARFDGIFWFGALSAENIVQVALMQVSSYYLQHGLQVNYLSPEVLMQIMRDNEKFKGFGVRQLIQIIRHKSDIIISAAKSKGWTDINITSDQNGNLAPSENKKQRIAA